MPGKRGRPRKYDPEVALMRAGQVFWSQGFSGTSLDQLSDAMGMNRPSLYNAFGDKEAIYRSALSQFCGKLDVGIEASLGSESDLRKGLANFFDQALEIYCASEPGLGCMMMCTAPAESLAHPEVRKDLKELIESVDTQLERRVIEAIESGDYPADRDARMTAKLIQAVLHSLALRARAGEARNSLSEFARFSVGTILGH